MFVEDVSVSLCLKKFKSTKTFIVNSSLNRQRCDPNQHNNNYSELNVYNQFMKMCHDETNGHMIMIAYLLFYDLTNIHIHEANLWA